MPTYEDLDRRDRLGESDVEWRGDIWGRDPGRARTTISQRDITTTDVREDSVADMRYKIMNGLYVLATLLKIPDYLWDWIGLKKEDYLNKGVNVAAEQQAKILASQNAARVRIEVCCC